jgi:hypothetical protein
MQYMASGAALLLSSDPLDVVVGNQTADVELATDFKEYVVNPGAGGMGLTNGGLVIILFSKQ